MLLGEIISFREKYTHVVLLQMPKHSTWGGSGVVLSGGLFCQCTKSVWFCLSLRPFQQYFSSITVANYLHHVLGQVGLHIHSVPEF